MLQSVVEKWPKGRLKPDREVQVPRPVVLKQPKGYLRGHLWNQEKSNWEINRSNMVLQKFYFGKSCACGVGWVAKQYAAPGMGAAPAVAPLGQDPRTGVGGVVVSAPGAWPSSLCRTATPKYRLGHLGLTPGWAPCLRVRLRSYINSPFLSWVSLCCCPSWVCLAVFFLILPSFPTPNWCKLSHVWKQTAASARLSISQSHLPPSAFLYFFRCTDCPVVSWSLEVSDLQPSCFRVSITKTVRPGKNWDRRDTLG